MSTLLRRAVPSFCFITPTNPSYLEVFATQSRTHLVLAHIVEDNDQYAAFYKARAEAGDFVICDNGAFELGFPYNVEDLTRLGKKCGANALVLPDYPFKPADDTIEAARQYIPEFKAAGFLTFFVPQSETGNFNDWVRAYEWASNNPDIDIIGMSILGIPNALPHIPAAYARVVATEILMRQHKFAHHKFHHYLGLNAAPNVELPSLLSMRALDTCDSSNPVWCGVNGLMYNKTLTDFMPISKKYLREVDFEQEYPRKHHIRSTIQHNVDLTLDIFNRPEAYL